MNRIYFDNAATTSLDSNVLESMMPYLTEKFGNPSSIYSYGRESKMAIENARKSVSKLLGVNPGEIFFTSGGTESSNMAINAAIKDLNCQHIISSAIEHHATMHCTEAIAKENGLRLSLVETLPNGSINLMHLEELLIGNKEKTLVSLMHANNEIGNITNIEAVGNLCEKYEAIFHCDMVQTIGHYPIDLSKLKVHFASASGHKFHGPKGVGILYLNSKIKINPLLHGGAQERNMRAGTENIYGIVGFGKALEQSMEHYEKDSAYIFSLKKYFHDKLIQHFDDVRINGDAFGSSLYTILNISFPKTEKSSLLLFNLDMAGICVSGGSACSSGTTSISHVLKTIYPALANEISPIRFSFCKHNTIEEIDIVIEKLKELK